MNGNAVATPATTRDKHRIRQHPTTCDNTRQHPTTLGSGALTKFNISSNEIRAEGGKALAAGLQGNQVITELNIADNNLTSGINDVSGVIALADVISGMRAMMSLTFGDKEVVTMTTKMTEANFSGKLYSSEAQIVAAFLPKCT
jgi:glutamate-1-semialdehyde aminotransferase